MDTICDWHRIGLSEVLHCPSIVLLGQCAIILSGVRATVARKEGRVWSYFDVSVSNSLSGRDWELDQVPAVGDPTHIVQIGTGHRVSTGEGQRRVALQ